MTTHDEYEASRKKYLWESVQKLNVLHSELSSLYHTDDRDQRRVRLIWDSIENLETMLALEGVDYEEYATRR